MRRNEDFDRPEWVNLLTPAEWILMAVFVIVVLLIMGVTHRG